MDSPALRLHFAGTADAVREALADPRLIQALACYSEDLVINAEIVLAEVLNNIVEHAYAQVGGDIQLVLSPLSSGLACRLSDHGAEMPGLQLPKGAFQPLGEIVDLPEGGFGWFLIRSLVQDLRYERVEGENILSFRLVEEQSATDGMTVSNAT